MAAMEFVIGVDFLVVVLSTLTLSVALQVIISLSSWEFPTNESMYGALTRVVQPPDTVTPRCWQREAGASQRYADDFV
jgi:hypothetical protein